MMSNPILKSIPWETRNLHCSSYEINIEGLQEAQNQVFLSSTISQLEEQHGFIFIQARLGKEYISLYPLLQTCGFYFIETTLHPSTDISKNEALRLFNHDPSLFIPEAISKNSLHLSILDRSESDLCQRVREIACESFTDDRFHVDPQCPNDIANQRYGFWVDDMLKDPATCFHLIWIDSLMIGFMVRKENELLLAGFAQSHINKRLGNYLWLSTLQYLQKEGFKETQTTISAFNTAVLNLYARLGFKFKNPEATFHYWTSFNFKTK